MSPPRMIDAHTHVQFTAFQNDREAVIRRALDAGIWLINAGTQQDTSRDAVEIANKYNEGVYAAVGLHPIHTDRSFHDREELGDDKEFTGHGEEFDYEYYKKLAQHPKVVAIGECGLDFYRISGVESRQKQERAFIRQIELAGEIKKPIMIHCREAYDDLIKILQTLSSKLQDPPGIIHFFSGAEEHAQKLLDMGFYFSFGGVITFAKQYEDLVKYIPLDRILLETDAPYVSPAPYRGQRNEPLYVAEVAKKLSEIKNADPDEAARHTTENAKSVFGI